MRMKTNRYISTSITAVLLLAQTGCGNSSGTPVEEVTDSNTTAELNNIADSLESVADQAEPANVDDAVDDVMASASAAPSQNAATPISDGVQVEPAPIGSASAPRKQTDNTGAWVVGGVIVAGIACYFLCSSGKSTSGGGDAPTTEGGPRSPESEVGYDFRPTPQPETPKPPEPAERTYGLHGDCPQSGAGYGC